jgi:hypothetical protein
MPSNMLSFLSGRTVAVAHPSPEAAMGRIVVREVLTLDLVVCGPGDEIPLEVWLQLPVQERNTLLNLGKVERE